jgi:hypothetical protein
MPHDKPSPTTWLLHRAAFGPSESSATELAQLGHSGWLQRQLAPTSIPDLALDLLLASHTWTTASAYDLWHGSGLSPDALLDRYKGLRLVRAVHSERQLLERTVEFWNDHFCVARARIFTILHDRDAVRPHALGRFRDLLGACVGGAGLLHSFGNQFNVVGGPNENLARELLELHTLGVDGPWGEHDVREIARCFTGWSFDADVNSPTFGEFSFVAQDHDDGPKSALGASIPAGGGIQDGRLVLDLLAAHPATAEFVTRKLAVWFLGAEPPAAIVAEALQAWLATSGSIAAVIGALTSSRALDTARPWSRPRFKRPLHWLVSLLRATDTTVTSPESALALLREAGHEPFGRQMPDGYPDGFDAWSRGLQPRWAIASDFALGTPPAFAHSSAHLLALLGGAPRSAWGRLILARLCRATERPVDVLQLQSHIDALGAPDIEVAAEAFELAAASPSFQRH